MMLAKAKNHMDKQTNINVKRYKLFLCLYVQVLKTKKSTGVATFFKIESGLRQLLLFTRESRSQLKEIS